MKRFFPNVIVFGGMRCGTTSLYRYLSAHPDVYASSKKELDIFYNGLNCSDAEIANKYQDAFMDYSGVESVLLEASPRYARRYNEVSTRIAAIIPDVKIIYLIRDPINRIESVYWSVNRSGALIEGISFDQFITALFNKDNSIFAERNRADGIIAELELGLYSPIISRLIETFGKENVHVESLENLAGQPEAAMGRVCCFVGLDASFYEGFSFSVENPSINARWPSLYKVALRINSKLEPLLNHVPKIRAIIRGLHHVLNQKDRQSGIADASMTMLVDYYAKDKAELLNLVYSSGACAAAPDWLLKRL